MSENTELSKNEKVIADKNASAYAKANEASTANTEKKASRIGDDQTTVTTVILKTDRRKLDVLAASNGLEFTPWLAQHLTDLANTIQVTVAPAK